jgi:hypothetical protein
MNHKINPLAFGKQRLAFKTGPRRKPALAAALQRP